jgi:hypothetical protein
MTYHLTVDLALSSRCCTWQVKCICHSQITLDTEYDRKDGLGARIAGRIDPVLD